MSEKHSNESQVSTWMMWREPEPKGAWPAKSLTESLRYFTQKYGHHPVKALFPAGTELTSLQPLAANIPLEVSHMVLPKHIHLAFDPGATKERI